MQTNLLQMMLNFWWKKSSDKRRAQVYQETYKRGNCKESRFRSQQSICLGYGACGGFQKVDREWLPKQGRAQETWTPQKGDRGTQGAWDFEDYKGQGNKIENALNVLIKTISQYCETKGIKLPGNYDDLIKSNSIINLSNQFGGKKYETFKIKEYVLCKECR